MELARFIFWTALKALGLVFLGLLAGKGIGSLRSASGANDSRQLTWAKRGLTTLAVALAVWGGRSVGLDVAAENYAYVSQKNLSAGQVAKAYENSSKAVEMRPGVLRYWRALERAKFAQRQFASVVTDSSTLESLSGGSLEEEDSYRLAASYYFLAQFDKTVALTTRLIKENRSYAAPYVLQGFAYTAQKDFPKAERTFLEVLQMFPTHQAAVEGLAHAHFLRGNTPAALSVLEQTARFPFSPEARQRFAGLKALYAQ